ncbi:MAG: hypothetical protein WBD40_09605 [Tepidisphaeraceae bacterium]
MGIRENLAKHQKATAVTAGAVIVAALVFLLLSQGGGAPSPSSLSSAYFSADDGATYAGGDGRQVREMEALNPPKYLATVFQPREGGAAFVGYLTRLPPASLDAFNKALTEITHQKATLKQTDPALDNAVEAYNKKVLAIMATTEVKRPGAANKWVVLASSEGQEIISNIKSPSGSTNVKQVYPG